KEAINSTADDSRTLREKFLQSDYLRDFRTAAQQYPRGCIVLEMPSLLHEVIERHGAKDGTVRGTAMDELSAMRVRTSQYHPGHEIPEKHWAYRIAKRLWFHDSGVYDGHDHTSTAAPGVLEHSHV